MSAILSRLGEGSTHAGLAVLSGLATALLPAVASPYASLMAALFAGLAVLIPDTPSVTITTAK